MQVRESLTTNALLRLPYQWTKKQKIQRVEELLDALVSMYDHYFAVSISFGIALQKYYLLSSRRPLLWVPVWLPCSANRGLNAQQG